jgi:hypothetical protein
MTTIESMRRLACAFALLILAGGPLSMTASAEDLGPPVGTIAPDIGTRLDQTGRPHRLTDLMGKNGLMHHVQNQRTDRISRSGGAQGVRGYRCGSAERGLDSAGRSHYETA